MNNKREPDPGTISEQTIARLTQVLTAVAIVQAAVASLQWYVAQKALWDAETPNVKLWAEGLTGVDSGLTLEAQAHIKNTGSVTLFNGKIYSVIGLAEKGRPDNIWRDLEPDKTNIVMGPDDEEITRFHWRRLTAEGYRLLKSDKIVIAVAQKIEFPDSGGRVHHRYYCQYWWYNHGRMIDETCSTPVQD